MSEDVSEDLSQGEMVLSVRDLSVRDGAGRSILRRVDLDIPRHQVTGIIGPSGVGKSTLLRCLNRLIDLSPALDVSGSVRFHGDDIRAPGCDPDRLRQRIGIVFQQPVVFPGSVARNVLFGASRLGLVGRGEAPARIEAALTAAGLWREVRDRLGASAATLSVGQQQRLALARCLAVEPEVVLLDEPTSALDPRSTELIEQTVTELRQRVTVVLVTHDLDQSRRVADWVACICPKDGAGELVEAASCDVLFGSPARAETREYLGLSC